ncbi:MAG: protein-L-isoaspartate(D-aspartate) O-methyltransferase [Candidatus Aenigmarchaeota archaeon]|nr:protein-L-isoaspartate(D-aspartate) O-methyltransferase [Candidatus Aenigmarchaeota archaeon]
MSFKEKREKLVREIIETGFLRTEEIIAAFRKVPREEFVLPQFRDHAYANEPLPIAAGQTISQPLTVAAMTEALQPEKGQKILEVGSGSGYQAAILAEIAGNKGKIITTEFIPGLAKFAEENLKRCGYKNVFVILHDGSQGYEKEKPYDRIIVTAAAPNIPEPLIDQLKKGGKLVIPVGDEMFLVEKNKEIKKTFLGYYAFVPLKGKHGYE